MRMNRKLLFSLLLSMSCLGALAQPHDLVAASGASFQNGSGYISFSIGEPVTMTVSSASAVLTQGFQQTEYQPGVSVADKPAYLMNVYPNPVRDLLTLEVEATDGFDYLLYDSRGGLVSTGQVLDEHMEIDVSALSPSVYILKVTNHKEETRLFQIVKY